jgi:predicted PolB exonuclease-like 3'-5' exonuclease
MNKVVFDIETVGQDFDLLDETSKEYFLKFAETDEAKEEAKNSLSFYPVTAQIVAIGMLDGETDSGFVYFQNGGKKPEKFTDGNVSFISGSEKEILNSFWAQMKKYPQFVTFNGRVFDCPFIMLRSAINGIRTTKNLVPYRYSHNEHIDLSDQLTFYDAMRRKFSLHMWCKAFGIESPKEQGMTGLQVKDYFKEGRYQEIARYCFADIRATKELYQYWEKYLKF